MPSSHPLQPDTQEIILGANTTHACETYLFEPGAGEERLGWLFAAAQTDDRGGVGSELLDTLMTAIQREYYREPNRVPSAGFEMALHQANLILHDMAEQGMRDWMPSFGAVVAVLARNELHVSVAGHAQALLIRKGTLTDVSTGLAQVPIVNPLQTFSQVASGIISPLDTLLLSTNPLTTVFVEPELKRISQAQSAEEVGMRLQQRYNDTQQTMPLAAVVTTVLAQYVASKNPKGAPVPSSNRSGRAVQSEHLMPRQPLVVRTSTWRRVLAVVASMTKAAGKYIQEKIWPSLKVGSRQGGRAIVQASKTTGENIHKLAKDRTGKLPPLRTLPAQAGRRTVLLFSRLQQMYTRLPKSSKALAIISVILIAALGTSVLLLQRKQTEDTQIQAASETLHSAQTKVEAAKTALIYDNRSQAEGLLGEAKISADSLVASKLYIEEATALLSDIEKQYDQLQRVSRAGSDAATIVGDVSSETEENPNRLFYVADTLYTFNPDTNAIIRVTADGSVSTVHQTTQGIGFFSEGITHLADKTITFVTDPAGIAIFDSKDNSLASQEITLASEKPDIVDLAVFGNRLYIYDKSINNILVYNKTLRGYSSGSPWITDTSFPSTSITSFGIDGSVYTLHQDGKLRKLFKGENEEFTAEEVDPPLPGTAKIHTTEELSNIYVVDSIGKRVVIYNKKGQLLRQVLVEFAHEFSDAIPHPDEDRLYILDGTRILEISLVE